MTPKEKALELVNRFYPFCNGTSIDSIKIKEAKEIALICVEEIVMTLYDEGNKKPQYWYDVEEEIKLIQ